MLALSFFKLFAAFNSTWIIWSSSMHAIGKELLSVCFMPGAVLGAAIETTVNSTETTPVLTNTLPTVTSKHAKLQLLFWDPGPSLQEEKPRVFS